MVSVAYFALINNPEKYDIVVEPYYKDIRWYPINSLPTEIAFDHKKIISFAHERLKNKIMYTNIAYSLVPEKFTFTRLQKIYEEILGETVDKRNFRKRMKSFQKKFYALSVS